jgi:DNA-binding SARP family transcriptional activator
VTTLVDRPAAGRVRSYEHPPRLRLLGGFDLSIGQELVTLPLNVRRLLAYLAVRERPQSRTSVAYSLWMDTTATRACANLRTALWKIGAQREHLLRTSGSYLSLAPDIHVDLAHLVCQAKRLIAQDVPLEAEDTDPDSLAGELLPEWDDQWILVERERLRQLRVHALEALCRRLRDDGRHAEAVDAGQAAVAAEPLRETAQHTLISAHLAEGNVYEARRQFELYRRLMWDNLQLPPSPGVSSLLAVAGAGRP